MGETIDNPTPLERNVMNYTAPFLPYAASPDPVWELTNTDKALGRTHARTPMSEKVLTCLLGRFMAEEVAAREAPAEEITTFPEAAVMLAGV